MPRKPASNLADTRRNIRDAAFSLFGRYGYEGVSIESIATKSGLSKGALYWHFKGKNELFVDCLQRLHRIFFKYVFNPMRDEEDASRSTLALFTGLAQLMADTYVVDGIAGYWLDSNRTVLKEAARVQSEFEEVAFDIIRDTLQRGVEQGLFDFEDDLEQMSRAIIALIEAIVLPLRPRSPEEIQQLLEVLARTLFRAYSASSALPESLTEKGTAFSTAASRSR